MDDFDYRDAFDLGYLSYMNDRDNGKHSENPYTGVDEDDLYAAWEDGYHAAMWDD